MQIVSGCTHYLSPNTTFIWALPTASGLVKITGMIALSVVSSESEMDRFSDNVILAVDSSIMIMIVALKPLRSYRSCLYTASLKRYSGMSVNRGA